jgi:photosystem II stability/assembly factor-like uncharacterized protein
MRGHWRKFGGSLAALALLLCGLGLLGFALAPKQHSERPDIERLRQEWFYGQRAYPHRYIPARARLRALHELEQKLQLEQATRASFADPNVLPNPAWSFIGPQPVDTPYSAPIVSGRVSAIAINPTNVNTVYIGAAQGGVWKTTNGGNNWVPLTDTQPSLAIGSLVLDPSNPNIIYAGTGDEAYGAGILKSTDAGVTWTQMCGPFCGPLTSDGYFGGGGRIHQLAIHPTNHQIFLAATELVFTDGVYRSTDGGSSWTRVLSGNPGDSVLFDPTNGNIAYASLGGPFSTGTSRIYKSTNAGQSWVEVFDPPANAGRIGLAMATSTPTTLYAGIGDVNTGELAGFYKTTNGGTNWTSLPATPNYCDSYCNGLNFIAVQPTNPNVIFAGGAFETTLVRSTDGGASWATLQSAQNFGFMHADIHALSFFPDGNTLYVGNDGGMYVTTQVTASNPTFTALNNTLGITQFYPGISVHPTNVSSAIGGTQDQGTDIYSGSLIWNDVLCGDGSYTAIDPSNPATMYGNCAGIDIQKSTTGGGFGSWTEVSIGIDQNDRALFLPPLVMDRSSPQKLYFGTYRVYQTTNGAASWAAISPDLTAGNTFDGVISTIAVAPSDSNTVYIGTHDSRVQVTTNAGNGASATWTNVSASLPPRAVTCVAVDPATSTTAYVAFSGFTGFGDNLGHVFKTTTGGGSWTDISGDLPNIPVNWLVTAPGAPNILFVATDIGVFYTNNAGTTWNSLVNGLPRVTVLGLALHAPTHILRAATHGRGMWDVDIGSIWIVVQSAVSRKTHGAAGAFDVNLPLTGTPGIECRGGSATSDYTMVVTFSDNVTVTGSPQAQVTSGVGSVGSGGVSNGGMVTSNGNNVTIPLTNVANAQRINVTLYSVNGGGNIIIPMGVLLGDTTGNGSVNATDVSQTKLKSGQAVNATNFRNDVTVSNSINATDVSQVKLKSGTALP